MSVVCNFELFNFVCLYVVMVFLFLISHMVLSEVLI